MVQRGGKRLGAGRKPGASFAQMVSPVEKKKFVEFILATYMGDMKLAVWVGDQLFGKAPQPIQGEFSGTLTLTFDDSFISASKANK